MEEMNLKKVSKGKLTKTVEECHEVISFLLKTVFECLKKIEQLELEIKELKNPPNSSNSSLPPSKDLIEKEKETPCGGQLGHKGYL